MKILITGDKGFIGHNLLTLLAKSYNVDGLEWGEEYPSSDELETYDWVCHLGAISATTERDVEKVMKQNFDFSVRLLNDCDYVGTNFQYASSASVYGLLTEFNEDDPKDPRSAYAWSKYLFDRYVSQYSYSIIVQGFRYFNVYGLEGEHEEHKNDMASPVTKFRLQAQNNHIIKVFEHSDEYKRDFVWVQDVCRAHVEMFDVKDSGVFNIGTGTAVSFGDVARKIADEQDAKIEEIPFPEKLRGQYQEFTKADMTKFNKVVPRFEWRLVV